VSSFLFIDDSGSKEWDTPYAREFVDNPPARTAQNRTFWQSNYFVLTGLYMPDTVVAELNPYINDLKKKYFGTKYVEIKSVHLRNPEKRKKYYLEPYGIDEEKLRDFIENNWYRVFTDHINQIQLQAFVLDKRYHKNRRHEISPLEMTSLVLFDRVELHPNRTCTIVFDQMDEQIKSVKHNQGKIISIAGKDVDLGSLHNGKYSHSSIRFEKSVNSNFLQLADTAAYNVLRQFIDYGDQWELPVSDNPRFYGYFDLLRGNFYNNPKDNCITGYGVVKIPKGDRQHGWKLS
jgi:hypothetical protein